MESDYQPRKKPVQYEHIEQVNFFKACFEYEPYFPEFKMIFAIPNGGVRGGNKLQKMITGKKLKLEGVRKGIPDIFIAVPRGGYHGMFIEMKYGSNTPSPEQVDWIERLRAQGYKAIVCYSSGAALDQTIKYLGVKI